jgi:hypothetical protein
MADVDWSDALIAGRAGDYRRVLERYLLPGKATGFVVVCEHRRCFRQIRFLISPLGLLPRGVSPEDRKAVVAWAIRRGEQLRDIAFRHAVSGAPMPDPFSEEVSDA